MLTISETIALHRRTRDRYMLAASCARSNMLDSKVAINRLYAVCDRLPQTRDVIDARAANVLRLFSGREFHKGALLCFIRRARRANHMLIDVKRFERQLTGSYFNGRPGSLL